MLKGPDYAVSKEKRALDIAVATAMLVPAAAGLLVVRRALRGSGESAIYRQKRVGFKGKLFEIIKLHTLNEDDETPLFDDALNLRDSRIDETPQAWNILKKEMSAVAHRPLQPEMKEELMGMMTPAMQRDYVTMENNQRPGLFGHHSIDRYVTHTQGPDVSPERADSEIQGFYNSSLKNDLLILADFAQAVIDRATEQE